MALTRFNCENLITRNLKIQNVQQIHFLFKKCSDIRATGLQVTGPGSNPNTDGIHVAGTRNIEISSSIIGTGDDCISFVDGSQDVQAMEITCGPGHGISIGSLGSGNSEARFSGVTVDRANFSGTTNGVRIKISHGGSGSAGNIKFQNIEMHDVSNPIIAEQSYHDQDEPCRQQILMSLDLSGKNNMELIGRVQL
ncbi:polygalacturonase-like [Rhodamnia argentea]|uniref:Polygalacturonase-like n=1 Tax=Rhodamnia argentea TaxID=178133 RepID=A0ABM3HZU0_9MYRT|nr:polygalacturonase-like [Rhodamnia argentea]